MTSRNRPNTITHRQLVQATARIIEGKPKLYNLPCGKVADGVLYLRCAPSMVIDGDYSVSKSWLWRSYEGTHEQRRSCWHGLGSFDPADQLALEKARIAAATKAMEIAAKATREPHEHRPHDTRPRHEAKVLIARKRFNQVAEAYIIEFTPTWRDPTAITAWRGVFKNWINPIIGDKFVDEITPEDVLAVLRQKIAGEEGDFWLNRTTTAKNARSRIEAVLRWSAEPGPRWRPLGPNPAGRDSIGTLPKPSKIAPVQEHPALDYRKIPELMGALDTRTPGRPHPIVKRAIAFLILTGVRTAEVRKATWSEINLQDRVWTLKPERTKKFRLHRVPLSDAAIAILLEMRRLHPGDVVFPAIRKLKHKRFLGNSTLLTNLHTIHPDIVMHGFRSTFRMWAGEKSGAPYPVCEAAIAHAVGSRTGRAYDRSDYFEDRIPLMNAWAHYCLTGKTVRWKPLDG
jgi:integrase